MDVKQIQLEPETYEAITGLSEIHLLILFSCSMITETTISNLAKEN